MNINDYKELMLFHLMDVNTTRYKYAAVDADGELCAYIIKPILEMYYWINMEDEADFESICMMTPPEDFKMTLIEL